MTATLVVVPQQMESVPLALAERLYYPSPVVATLSIVQLFYVSRMICLIRMASKQCLFPMRGVVCLFACSTVAYDILRL